MRHLRVSLRVAVLLSLMFIYLTHAANAQTSTTGTVLGTVKDASGAVIPGAAVELTDTATKAVQNAVTSGEGQYVFTTLQPGTYSLKISAESFKQAVASSVIVEVAKSTLVDVSLEVGELSSVVNVTSSSELQTVDATVGEVVNTQLLQDLPTVTRRVVELAFLQVASQPNTGNANLSRSIAGGRGDQNTFTLDGLDVSDTQVGGTCCGNIGTGIPLPVEAIGEFRASVTNQNATFGRSSGGQYALTSRRGSEDYHGTLYWFHRNDNLNANTWLRNRLGQTNPELKDNRYGFSVGGPLLGPVLNDRLFFFTNIESRRFPKTSDTSRLVPTASLRQGILRFPDNAGNVISYDLKSSTTCGPNGNLNCDPRGIGISPIITSHFSLLPQGNNASLGDSLNTIGVTSPVDTTESSDNALARIDYNLTDNWRVNGLWVWAQQSAKGNTFIDIRPGVGGFNSLYNTPNHPRFYSVGVTGTLSPSVVNEARFGYNRSSITFENPDPTQLVAGSGMALDLAGLDEPYDISGSRAQVGRSTTWQLVDNLTWTKGKHTFQPGVNIQWSRFFHSRRGAGSLNVAPIAVIGGSGNTVIPAAQRPVICSATRTTNCLRAADVSRWDTFYGAALGIVDTAGRFVVRNPNTGEIDSDQQVLTEGEINEGTWQHYEFYVSDTWRLSSSLTLSLGLNAMIERPFVEDNNRRSYLIDLQTNRPIFVNDYLDRRAEAAVQGQAYNPGFAFAPRTAYPDVPEMPTQRNVSPRVSVAWNPSLQSGFLGRLIGDRKSVLRGGFGINYDRVHAVGTVQFPMIGNAALAQPTVFNSPRCNELQTPGPNCVANTTPFRVGVDGPAPLPVVSPTIPIPYAPPQPFGLGLGSTLGFDPDFKLGRIYSTNLTLQRQLPGEMVVEAGWIGRFGRDLMVEKNLNAVPFFINDLRGGSSQNFAQAYDLIAAEMRRGVSPTGVTPQPWFESSLGAGSTRTLAASQSSAFINGLVYSLWFNGIDPLLVSQGRTPINNRQIYFPLYHTYGGYSNYNAGFVSLNKRFSRGFSFNLNYTLSKNLDTLGGIHDGSAGLSVNPYDLSYAYGPSLSDRTHGLNVYGLYELPIGPGKLFNPGGVIGKVVEGWQVSGVGQWFSGRPLFVGVGGQPYGAAPTSQESAPLANPLNEDSGRFTGVAGSNGVGTSGNPAGGGTGLNLFANPEAAFNSFRPFRISEDQRTSRGAIRGLPWATLDLSVSKRMSFTERVNFKFSADFLNVLNHPLFDDPALNLLNPATFGVLGGQPISSNNFYSARQIQLGLRLEF